MAALSTAIKIFRSTDAGAPTISGTAGTLIAALDACLVNGYNSKSGWSLVLQGDNETVIGTLAGHGHNQYDVVTFSGASDNAYNVPVKLESVTTDTVTFKVSGAGGSPTGTISSIKTAAGWTKPYNGTNLALYQINGGTGGQLKVDDTNATYAIVRGYLGATDITPTTYGDIFPSTSQVSANNYRVFRVANGTGDSTARSWCIIADDKFMHLFIAANASYAQFEHYVFGDINTYRTNDAYHCMIAACNSGQSTYDGATFQGPYVPDQTNSASAYHYIARSYTQQASTPSQITQIGQGAYAVAGVSYPNPVDSGWYVCKPILVANSGYRGELPGFYAQAMANSGQPSYTIWPAPDNLSGKTLMSMQSTNTSSHVNVYEEFIDIIGPWR